jgi:hypothetical protein
MKIFFGVLIGIAIGYIIWFPYGIMYAVQASDTSLIVKAFALIKGLIG